MAIRVFLCTWTEEQSGGLVYIHNPIDDYLANISLSAPVEGPNYYGKIALNRRPDKAFCIKVMRGSLTQGEWGTLAALPGVRAVPPGSFDKATSNINNPTKNKIYAVLDALGVSRSVFDSSATVGGFLRNLLLDLNNAEQGFGSWELDAAEWG